MQCTIYIYIAHDWKFKILPWHRGHQHCEAGCIQQETQYGSVQFHANLGPHQNRENCCYPSCWPHISNRIDHSFMMVWDWKPSSAIPNPHEFRWWQIEFVDLLCRDLPHKASTVNPQSLRTAGLALAPQGNSLFPTRIEEILRISRIEGSTEAWT